MDIKELVKQYRLYVRTTRTQSKARGEASQHGAFPTTLNGRDTNGKPQCLCGKHHFYKDCYYLNPSVRTNGWKPDANIQSTINAKLQSDSELKARIDRVVHTRQGVRAPSSTRPSSSGSLSGMNTQLVQPPALSQLDNSQPSAFTITSQDFLISEPDDYQASSYALRDSFILDSGATLHCCNNEARFTNIIPASTDDILIAGQNQIPIQYFGDVQITVTAPYGPKTVTLRNTAYVPSLQTSVVSLRKLIQNNVHWDTQENRLTYAGRTYCSTPVRHGQWVLEYNSVVTASAFPSSTEPKPATTATMDLWHKRLGHLREEAVRHLPQSATDALISSRDRYYIPPCETCRLSSARQQISRVRTDRKTAPFERVHLDLFPMRNSFLEDRYILHFLDDYSRMNYVYVLKSKSDSPSTVRSFQNLVDRQ